MTPEEQNIAIVEACGWRRVVKHGGMLYYIASLEKCFEAMPDCFNDLNLMHEAILVHIGDSEEKRDAYMNNLSKIIERDHGGEFAGDSIEGRFWTANAAAPQCAEAFLNTLNLWKD